MRHLATSSEIGIGLLSSLFFSVCVCVCVGGGVLEGVGLIMHIRVRRHVMSSPKEQLHCML